MISVQPLCLAQVSLPIFLTTSLVLTGVFSDDFSGKRREPGRTVFSPTLDDVSAPQKWAEREPHAVHVDREVVGDKEANQVEGEGGRKGMGKKALFRAEG